MHNAWKRHQDSYCVVENCWCNVVPTRKRLKLFSHNCCWKSVLFFRCSRRNVWRIWIFPRWNVGPWEFFVRVKCDEDKHVVERWWFYTWRISVVRVEKRQQQDRLSKLCADAGFLNFVKSDSVSWRKTLKSSHNSQIRWFVVSTLGQETKIHSTKKLDRREHQNWDRVRCCNLLPTRWTWIRNRIKFVRGSIAHEFEQQRARNFRDAVRRICVKIKCTCFCEPIKA